MRNQLAAVLVREHCRLWPTIPSLDRMQASKGYTRSNVPVVLPGVNGLRGNGTNEDMLLIARAVVKNRPNVAHALRARSCQLRFYIAARR